MYKVELSPEAEEDYQWLEKAKGRPYIDRVERLLEELARHPKTGIGRPKPLRGDLSGLWSRRIDDHHRLLYAILEERVVVYVVGMRGHYND